MRSTFYVFIIFLLFFGCKAEEPQIQPLTGPAVSEEPFVDGGTDDDEIGDDDVFGDNDDENDDEDDFIDNDDDSSSGTSEEQALKDQYAARKASANCGEEIYVPNGNSGSCRTGSEVHDGSCNWTAVQSLMQDISVNLTRGSSIGGTDLTGADIEDDYIADQCGHIGENTVMAIFYKVTETDDGDYVLDFAEIQADKPN